MISSYAPLLLPLCIQVRSMSLGVSLSLSFALPFRMCTLVGAQSKRKIEKSNDIEQRGKQEKDKKGKEKV